MICIHGCAMATCGCGNRLVPAPPPRRTKTVEEAARTMLDALRANWSQIPASVLSEPMRDLDAALGHPPARNWSAK